MEVAVDEGEGRHLGDRPGLALPRADDTRRVPEPPLDGDREVLRERSTEHAQLTEVPEQNAEDRRERGDRDRNATARRRRKPQSRRERSRAQETRKRRNRQVVGDGWRDRRQLRERRHLDEAVVVVVHLAT